MIRNVRQLENFELRARDGRIGHVTDFFFDDRRWTIRYFVVDTGTWLSHRDVLIAPSAVRLPDWAKRVLPVDLTQQQVRESPLVDGNDAVSRDEEQALAQYYSWPMYWGTPGFNDGLTSTPMPFLPPAAFQPRHAREPRTASTYDAPHHIRSVEDVRGYRLVATDGEIGHVDDFLVDDATWELRSLVVGTGRWWPGRRVLIAPSAIVEVGWNEERVHVDLTREQIKRSAEYDPAAPPDDYIDRPLKLPPSTRSSEP